ncbi:MAG: peptidoglycan-binding protein [Cyanobacteria bacterium J06623_5]
MTLDFGPQQLTEAPLPSEELPLVGIELIKQFTECRLQAYKHPDASDESSIYLAGWRSTHHKDGHPFTASDKLTQTQANELLHYQLQRYSLPILRDLPGWQDLNENQQGALLSFAHSLGNDRSALSPRSLLGKALRGRRWYQIPTIINGYHGPNPPAHIEKRRQEEANLFLLEIRKDQFTVINRSRLLELTEPAQEGQDIERLQRELVRCGYEIEIDGRFGPLTQWAVEKYQASVDLPVDGIAGVETQRIIYARALYLSDPYMMGSDIREIQSLLCRIGYAVDINGIFNLRTWQAVVAFQRYFGLAEDGIMQGKALATLLYLPAMAGIS